MRTALTIAGSDSGGGAGIQADLKTFAAFGVYGTSAITAVTAQNTRRVTAVRALDPEIVVAQIEAVASDIGLHAVKTGMLATAAITEAVAGALARLAVPANVPVVVDPVMVAKSGDHLLERDAVDAVRRQLLPLCAVLTPNRPEAEVLAGVEIRSVEAARDAARRLHDTGARAVVIKGGHFEGPVLVNLLFDGAVFSEHRSARIETRHTHGTGCTFAAAVAAALALGASVHDAVADATAYVEGGVRAGLPLGSGHGPLNHFWRK